MVFATVLIVLAAMLLLGGCSLAEGAGSSAVSESNDNYGIGDGTNWGGSLTNVDFDLSADAHIPKDFHYLPWKDGKYTIAMDPAKSAQQYRDLSASAEQPLNMSRGVNARVNLILESTEKIQYHVDKSWDIDYAKQDRPDSIEVLLQAEDQLLLLVTCTARDDERRVVAARRIREGEKKEGLTQAIAVSLQ